MARAKRITVAPFLNVDQLEGENEEESVSVMSPLPPPLKGTFVDKLPSWSETSKDVNPPDAYLNANTTGEKCVEIYSEVQALKFKY